MTIETKIVARLSAFPAVANAVGTRIFPVVVRGATAFPSVTYTRLPGERTYTLAGRGRWATTRVGLTAWSQDYAAARQLADDMRDALDAYSDGTDDGIQIASVTDGPDGFDNDAEVYGCTIEVAASFLEA